MIIGYIIVGIFVCIGVYVGIQEMVKVRRSPRIIKKEEKQGDIYLYIDMK